MNRNCERSSFAQLSYVASLAAPTASDTRYDHDALAKTAVNNAFWRRYNASNTAEHTQGYSIYG
jgi:hypothetical protein